MTSMTNYLEKKLLDHTLGKAAYTMPAAVYVALFKADPGEAGSTSNEVGSGIGYTRQELTSRVSAADATAGTAQNTAAITFGPATNDWGTITHAGIMDAATGGNMLFYAPLAEPKTFATGDSTQYAAGGLTFQLA